MGLKGGKISKSKGEKSRIRLKTRTKDKKVKNIQKAPGGRLREVSTLSLHFDVSLTIGIHSSKLLESKERKFHNAQ